MRLRRADFPRTMTVAVIGAGIQGCSVALELASRGVPVTLFEQRSRVLDGASRHNEGKIHLGFVYAADPSLRTARLMARGAGRFAPTIARWLGPELCRDAIVVSRPFTYAVHRDSLFDPDELEATYARIADVIAEEIPPGDYFGVPEPGLVERLSAGQAQAYGTDVAAAFRTAEIAVEPDALADGLATAVAAHREIEVVTDAVVHWVDAQAATLGWRLTSGGDDRSKAFSQIVNCAWGGRLALDESAGLAPPPNWSFRMKYFARIPIGIGEGAVRLPSTTVVLGPFGDVVDYGDGTAMCAWYPVGRRQWSGEIDPPDWASVLHGEEAQQVIMGTADGLSGIVPAASELLLGEADRASVRGGVIYARGDTDVDDTASELHERHQVGVFSHGRYHSIDTGKYTTAPLFAVELADRITGTTR